MSMEFQPSQFLAQLMDLASTSQDAIQQFLDLIRLQGSVAAFKSYYVFNGIWDGCHKAVIEELAGFPSISKIDLDEVFYLASGGNSSLINRNSSLIATQSSSGYWWNISKIGADKVRDNLQVDGTGALVGIIAHGFDGTHPDLAPRWKSLYGWKDFICRRAAVGEDDAGEIDCYFLRMSATQKATIPSFVALNPTSIS